MTSNENSADSTPKRTPLGRAYTRVELQEKFEDMPVSDALDKIPAFKAYQYEWIARMKKAEEDIKGEMERLSLRTQVTSEKKTVKERELEGELVSKEAFDLLLSKARLDTKLAEAGWEYLEDRFIAIRKEVSTRV